MRRKGALICSPSTKITFSGLANLAVGLSLSTSTSKDGAGFKRRVHPFPSVIASKAVENLPLLPVLAASSDGTGTIKFERPL